MSVEESKRCPRCRRGLTLEAFARDRSTRDGLRSICKRCDNERCRRYYAKHRKVAERRPRAASIAAAARRVRVAELRRAGLSVALIGRELGVPATTIDYDVRVLGLETPAVVVGVDGRAYPQRGPEASDLARRVAAKLRGEGWSIRVTAAVLGVGRSSVQRWAASR